MKIGPQDTREKVIVVAEIGNNHEGDIRLAEEMIRAAAQAGVDVVKFQAIEPLKLVSAKDRERLAQLERFRLSPKQFERLKRVADAEKIQFLCTPFSLDAVCFFEPLVPAFKIASGDNTFFPLLEAVARTGKPLILSTGLCSLAELRGVQGFIQNLWEKENISQEMAFLHCVVSYPTKPEQANLGALRTLAQLGAVIGYSDHTLGIEGAVLSVALGARIIEKHFTLNKQQSSFRDHQLSAAPEEMRELVVRIREAEKLLGPVDQNNLVASDTDMAIKVRRSIVASRPLAVGAVIRREDLNWIRPGEGLAPGRENELIGHTLNRAIMEGEYILLKDLEPHQGDH